VGCASIGILLKSFNRLRPPDWSTGLYVAMGWLVLIAAVPLIRHVPLEGLLWLLAGGLAYTAERSCSYSTRSCATRISSGTYSCSAEAPATSSPRSDTLRKSAARACAGG
jgi:predicted membrane metal-binding protein